MPADTIQITKPAPLALVAEMSPIVKAARAFEVNDIDTDRLAQERGAILRRAEKSATEHFEPSRKAIDTAKKEILAARDAIIAPWAEARAIYFSKSDTFQAVERRKAEAESRRLQELARKEEEERQIEAAIDAENRGDAQESAAILAEPVSAPVVTVAPAVAKVAGVTTRSLWGAQVEDVRRTLRWLLEREEWLPLMEKCIPVLETGLRPLATAQRQALSIPGVRAVETISRSTR